MSPIDRYNDILVNGLPDWRQPVYYYRRVRKMSNAELGFLLFLILTVGHYAVIWSIYLEKQLVSSTVVHMTVEIDMALCFHVYQVPMHGAGIKCDNLNPQQIF